MQIHFLGASGTVTGSKYLVEFSGRKILVDCGLFQGVKELRELNWQQFPVKATEIDIVLLTHGHNDHCGYLPRLVNMGFRGAIRGTAPTLDIAELILRDSAKIQEEDAEQANKDGYTKHKPAKPLFTLMDVEKTVPLFQSINEGDWLELFEGIKVRFRSNGHILGAASIEMELNGKRLVFSGDVGRQNDPLLYDPLKPQKSDYLVLESTYGDRKHPNYDIGDRLLNIINETVEKGGTVIIPSFAVERAQLLMYHLWRLTESGKLSRSIQVILDSPMGIDAFSLFRKHHKWHKLSEEECMAISRRTHMVESYKETWEIIESQEPKIVIAGSGMVTGGRVLSYLKVYLKKPETTVLLTGYQAEGTRGRDLLEGASEIKFFGKMHPVKARIEMLEGLSGHADQSELLDWISEIDGKPERTFLVHGESDSLSSLQAAIRNRFGWEADIPSLYQIVELK